MNIHEFHAIRHDRLLAAASMISEEARDRFFTILFTGLESTHARLESTKVGSAFRVSRSIPITVEEARILKQKVDDVTWQILMRAVHHPKEGVGSITWTEIKQLTGNTEWRKFAQGRLAGLNRSLRHIVNDNSAVLLFEAGHWSEQTPEDELLSIDGLAVESLRSV